MAEESGCSHFPWEGFVYNDYLEEPAMEAQLLMVSRNPKSIDDFEREGDENKNKKRKLKEGKKEEEGEGKLYEDMEISEDSVSDSDSEEEVEFRRKNWWETMPKEARMIRLMESEKLFEERKKERMKMDEEPIKREHEAYQKFMWMEENCWKIRNGDTHDLQQLLTSSTRNFLLKGNPPVQVPIEQLRGKHVVLYFAWLSSEPYRVDHYDELVEAYHRLSPQGLLEVVLVTLGDDLEDKFNSLLPDIPWLVLPYQDKEARHQLQQKFVIPDNSPAEAFLFSPTGTVVDEYLSLLGTYGSEAFPFTKDKLQQLAEYDKAFRKKLCMKQMSITELLGEYIITSQGKKVCTSSALQGKTVGLYFFWHSPTGISRTKNLMKLWKSMRGGDDEFEIVIDHSVNASWSDSKAELDEKLGMIPWYTLPDTGRKLSRVFKVDSMSSLKEESWFLIVFQSNQPPRTLSDISLRGFRKSGGFILHPLIGYIRQDLM